MEGDFIKINEWLLPISWLYRLGVGIRNTLFDWGVLPSKSYAIPIICVGNITVGGTGKTPHTEYLIKLLSERFTVAVLSRGYKRKSKGFLLAQPDTPMPLLGDEPFQIKQKFPHVYVAVDKNRRHGIEMLCRDDVAPGVDVIILDDAYQHRYVKPGVNILLTDYHRLICEDQLLPAGRLREPEEGKSRANIVIVTKCPHNIKPIDFRVIRKALHLYPYQMLFFSIIKYGNLWNMTDRNQQQPANQLLPGRKILLLTGIASPEQLTLDLEQYARQITHLSYPDHHDFSSKDMEDIHHAFREMGDPQGIIVTTEKDATRLVGNRYLSEELSQRIWVLPIEIEFLQENESTFNDKIIGYVYKNSRNSVLAKN